MPTITLNKTVGDAAANAYADVDDADARAALRIVSPLAAAWLAAQTDADKERKKSALITATMDVDTTLIVHPTFSGEKASDDQALLFPLTGQTAYPQNLVDATIELAFTLFPVAKSDPLERVPNDKKSFKADDVAIEYFAPEKIDASSFERWPMIVQRLLASFIAVPVATGSPAPFPSSSTINTFIW